MTRPRRILIADDVVANRELLAGILEPLDCRIDTAVNGREASARWWTSSTP